MGIKYKAAPHYRQKLSTQGIMFHLTIGLLIVFAFGCYRAFTLGSEYLINAIVLLLTSLAVALVTEALYALVSKQNVVKFIKNSFGWVTAIIIVLMVPVNTEPYAIAVSTFIAIFFGKLVFGGFGQNVFNPAAVGRAIIFASFAGSLSADLITTATPTATLASAGWLLTPENFEVFLNDFGGISQLFFGTYSGAIGETSTLLILAVGIYLTVKEVIDWRVPVTYLAAIFLGTAIIGFANGLGLAYALFHVFTGGAVFGAVFMLTDPVTNPNTRAGRIVFALVAAFFTMLIRFCGNLPEGVLYSILLANICTPIIDKYFDGKQVLREKKNLNTVIASALVVVVAIVGLGMTITPAEKYRSINVPDGETVVISSELAGYDPKLISQDGDTYVIEVKGFGLHKDTIDIAEETGHDYEKNVITVTVDEASKTVKAIEFTTFSDTKNYGDKCLEDIFMNQFDEAGLDSEINCVTGATYTSKSVIAAVNLALNGGLGYKKGGEVSLSEDFSKFKAEVTDNGNGVYKVTVRGFGLIDPDGFAEETGHEYERNEFTITVKDGKVESVKFDKFGDTEGFGDKCMVPSYLEAYVGKGLSDNVDTITSVTWTAKSVAAAVNAALTAAGN